MLIFLFQLAQKCLFYNVNLSVKAFLKKDVDNVNNQVNFGSDMLTLDGMSFLSGLTEVVLDELEISVKEYEGVNEVFCQKLNSQALQRLH